MIILTMMAPLASPPAAHRLSVFSGYASAEERTVPTILVIQSRSLPVYQQLLASFSQQLSRSELPPRVEILSLDGDERGIEKVNARLKVSPSPDLLVSIGSLAARSVAALHPTQPQLFTLVIQPAQSGLPSPGTALTSSLRGTITGISMDIPPEESLDALLDAFPQAHTVGVLMGNQQAKDASGPSEPSAQARLEKEASRRGCQLRFRMVANERELPAAVEGLLNQSDAILALPDPVLYSESSLQFLLLQTLRQSKPLGGVLEPITRAGALVSLNLDYADLGRQTADQGLKLLKKESPTPVVQGPRTLKRLLNLRTARRLGLKVPTEVLNKAEVVVP